MKRIHLILMVVLVSLPAAAQEFRDISLNAPDLNRGVTIMRAFEKRASATAFAPKELSVQDLSDLLWAADGINRSGSGKRTAPSAMNAQDIDIYLFTKEGTYLYDAKNNLLVARVQGDNRALVYDQQANFSNVPVFLVMISDISPFRGNDTTRNLSWAAMDAGIISQNISLFCAGTGLLTRPRAFMNSEGIKKLLNLTGSQYPMLNNPVGYPVQ